MGKLPSSQVELANLIYACIDLDSGDYPEGSTLLSVMSEEIVGKLTIDKVDKWLRGLPGAVSIPYEDTEIREILDSVGNNHWSIDDYWRWAASRVLAFADHPEAYR